MFHRRLTDEDKRELCSWRYAGEYAVYNLPSYEELLESRSGFMDPEQEAGYLAFLVDGLLTGFVHIMETPAQVLIGIGVRPELCGMGYGSQILNEACELIHRRFPAKPIVLVVRTWNLRAIRCYQRAGFRIDGPPYEMAVPDGRAEFFKMKKDSVPSF